jgi:hypothetical protein
MALLNHNLYKAMRAILALLLLESLALARDLTIPTVRGAPDLHLTEIDLQPISKTLDGTLWKFVATLPANRNSQWDWIKLKVTLTTECNKGKYSFEIESAYTGGRIENIYQEVATGLLCADSNAQEFNIEFISGDYATVGNALSYRGWVAKDEGCYRDASRAESLGGGLAFRKAMSDLLTYGCIEILDHTLISEPIPESIFRAFPAGAAFVNLHSPVNGPRRDVYVGLVPKKRLIPVEATVWKKIP